jgi:phage baseplate assembly protein V
VSHSAIDSHRRAYLSVQRGVVEKVNDKTKMQSVDVRVTQEELLTAVEHFQPYGHVAVPIKPGPKAAEAVIAFINGNRSHPVAIVVDDRRYRPTNWNAGEVGQYHYKGQYHKFTDTGWEYNAGNNKQPVTWTVGNSTFTIADGKITANVNGTKIVVTDGKIQFGDESANIPVMLETGPSQILFSTK